MNFRKASIEELPETVHFLISDTDNVENIWIEGFIEGQIAWNEQNGQSHIKYFNCPDYEKLVLKQLKKRWDLVALGGGVERSVKDLAKELGGTETFKDLVIL